MALLRRSLGVWTQILRHMAKEAPSLSLNPPKLVKAFTRSAPVAVLKNQSFLLNRLLDENKTFEDSDFVMARQDLLANKEFQIMEDKVDMLMVHLSLERKNLSTAMAYLEYLWKTQPNIGLVPMTHYLKLCYMKSNCELSEKEMALLLQMYERIRSQYQIMDGFTAECCLLGISKTDRWKEVLELCEIIKLSGNPRMSAYSAIISAAFKHDEPEIGWKYLREAFERLHPEQHVYTAYLEYCTRNFKGEDLEREIEKMFEFWREYDYRVYVEVIDLYAQTFQDLGWTVERTSIRDVGTCRTCSRKLKTFRISEEEFSKLAQELYDNVIIGGDIYQKTTPAELKYFLRFVEKRKPWDIVIDGLNVAYLAKSVRAAAGYLVKNTVTLCAEKMGKKVLVLGRQHMKTWPQLDLKYVEKHADIFFALNGSADDPYMLYATLSSGPSTMFISRDLMRQHVTLLQHQQSKKIFKNWQMTHQLSPSAVTGKNGYLTIQLQNPPNYLPIVQEDTDGWHLPFTFERTLIPPVDYEPPKSWMCFRKNSTTRFAKSPSLNEK